MLINQIANLNQHSTLALATYKTRDKEIIRPASKMSTPTSSKSKQATPSSSSNPNGRVFNDSDEIRLLKIYLKHSKSTLPLSSPSKATVTVDSATFGRIDKALDCRFTQAQITDKLRRLRVKYHKLARSKSRIKTPHDQKLYKIAQQIWGKKPKPTISNGDIQAEEPAPADDVEDREFDVAVEGNELREEGEAVDLEDYSVLVREFSRVLPHNSVWRDGLKLLGKEKLKEMDEKWMAIGIEELKIVAKRAQLVKEHTKLIMEVLGDANNGN